MSGCAALQAHTGKYLDVVNGCVRAVSDTPVAWRLRTRSSSSASMSDASCSSSGSGVSAAFRAGDSLRIKHQATGRWVKVASTLCVDDRALSMVEDIGEATLFRFEKQTWKIPGVEKPTKEITVRHLLTHTSGLDYAGTTRNPVTALDALARPLVERCERGEITTLERWTEELAKLPLRRQPGSRFQYGYSTDVLGRIVEILGGARLDIVLKRQVLDPLGMSSTGFAATDEDASSRLAGLYKAQETNSRSVLCLDNPADSWWAPAYQAPILGGGGGVETLRGGLLGTLSDYLRFAHMLLGKGELAGARVLRPETVELMTEVNHLGEVLGDKFARIRPGDGCGFCLIGGLALPTAGRENDPAHIPGMYGWNGWASTVYRAIPSAGVGVVFMTNCIGIDHQVTKSILRCVGKAVRQGAETRHEGLVARSLHGAISLLDWLHPRALCREPVSNGGTVGAATAALVATSTVLTIVGVGLAARRCAHGGHVSLGR